MIVELTNAKNRKRRKNVIEWRSKHKGKGRRGTISNETGNCWIHAVTSYETAMLLMC